MALQQPVVAPVEATPTPPVGPGPVGPWSRWRPMLPDAVVVVLLLVGFGLAHDLSSYLADAYWLDEAWVALSVRASWSDLPYITSSTPLGFSALLRLVPDQDALRLVPLVFNALTVVAGYALGRLVRVGNRLESMIVGVACAGFVLLLPAQQVRHDLKQYTADAAVTLTFFALAAWTESGWSRRRLGIIVGLVPVAGLLSHATMLAVPAVFGGLVLATAVRRQWRGCRDTIAAALAGGALLLAVFVGVTGRNRNDVLRVFWQDYYPSLHDLPGYLVRRYDENIALMGFVPTTLLVLLVVGVGFLFLHRNVATGAAVLAVPVIAIGLGVARLYPLLDLRTSHFLLVTIQAVAGIGVGALAVGAARLVREALTVVDRARSARPGYAVVGAVLAVVALVGYAGNNRVWYRFDGSEPGFAQFTQPAVEDTRAATYYVRDHIGPDDVLVMSGRARMSFAFYWADDVPLRWQTYPNAIGWIPELTGAGRDAESLGQTTDTIQGPIDRALAQARRNGPGGKVWLIRSPWDSSPEVWQAALSAYDAQPVTGIAVMIITNKK